MKKLTSKEIRNMWIDFWKSKGHEEIESKSLIPINDPTLLWINSGVATLKDYFSGKKLPKNPRMTNSQRSLRTNDIENVGVTARHHTLFEMLGNFSIGDYFKNEVLEWAYELLFEIFKFEKEKIYITYFSDDIETYNKWINLGINPKNLIKGNKKTNFWDIGAGPCGPDTEIFYDRGEKYDPENIGIKLLEQDLENDRYVEIWNIVFSEFNNDGEGNYEELAQKNIDTGAGLERIVSIFQDTPTNFETDLFMPIIESIEKMTNIKYDSNNYFKKDKNTEIKNKHFRIIADHIRAATVAINDGAKPSNNGRGYIIRRLIRRAYRSGRQLGINDKTFLFNLVKVISNVLDTYNINVQFVSSAIKNEEIAFSNTISQGEELLERELKGKKNLNFDIAFRLFETYGFPIELTKEIIESKGMNLDISQFEKYKNKHAEESRGKTFKGMKEQIKVIQEINSLVSEFTGYDETSRKSNVIFCKQEKGKYYVLLDKTPMYAAKGGQQSDKGTIAGIEVKEIFYDKYGNNWHILNEAVKGEVEVVVDPDIRLDKARNHSGTHILYAALRDVYGQDVVQLGSDNNEKRLRFDFPLDHKPTKEELDKVENRANEYIKKAMKREYIITSFEKGINMGSIALPGEDYGNGPLRVVKFENVIEFCGGTHVEQSDMIESIKITKCESRGSGIYRIEAITSNKTIKKFNDAKINELSKLVEKAIEKNVKLDKNYSISYSMTIESLNKTLEKIKEDNKNLNKISKNISISTDVEFIEFEGMKTYINLKISPSQVKGYAINLRQAHPDSLFIIGSSEGGKTTLVVASNQFNSKEIFDNIARKNNGRGGGNKNFAMGSMQEIRVEDLK